MSKLEKAFDNFKKGFTQGLGWSFGATLGFAVISTLVVVILNALGGLPLIGDFFASIVEATNRALLQRTSY